MKVCPPSSSFAVLLGLFFVSSVYSSCTTYPEIDFFGNDLSHTAVATVSDCCYYCQTVPNCGAWTFFNGVCYAKTSAAASTGSSSAGRTSGTVSAGCTVVANTDYFGNDISNKPVTDTTECCAYCQSVPNCAAWTLYLGVCYAKSSQALSNPTAHSGITSGYRNNQPTTPVTPTASGTACPKRGLAYTFQNSWEMDAVKGKISWWYNWDSSVKPAETNYKAYQIEYVPMIWGGNSLPTTIPAGSKYLLGFNEPNFYQQSNLQVTAAVSLWSSVQKVASTSGARIVSPAVNYCGGGCIETDPFVYLDKFFASCQGCQVDYIAVHWYACTADALTGLLHNLRKYNKKIWVTEFSCAPWDSSYQNSQQFQTEYMKAAVHVLENDPWVFRYAWFSGRTTEFGYVNVFGANGLTDLGAQYLNQPCGPAVAAVESDLPLTLSSYGVDSETWAIGVAAGVLVLAVSLLITVILVLARRPKTAELV